jgi:hypothetical protein
MPVLIQDQHVELDFYNSSSLKQCAGRHVYQFKIQYPSPRTNTTLLLLPIKGETIHRMYRNHNYFGDGSVHDTWRSLMIQTI